MVLSKSVVIVIIEVNESYMDNTDWHGYAQFMVLPEKENCRIKNVLRNIIIATITLPK